MSTDEEWTPEDQQQIQALMYEGSTYIAAWVAHHGGVLSDYEIEVTSAVLFQWGQDAIERGTERMLVTAACGELVGGLSRACIVQPVVRQGAN